MTDDSTIGTVDGPPRAVLVMFADSHCFGVFADEIEAVADWRTPTPLPAAPPGVLGVVCIRGRMYTVLAASALLGGTPAGNRKIVALRGDDQIALAIEQAGEMINIAPADLQASDARDSAIIGVIAAGDRSISVLDPKRLFAIAMRGRERRRRHF